jgi:hypothetical protein
MRAIVFTAILSCASHVRALRVDVSASPSERPVDPTEAVDLVIESKIAGVEVFVDGKAVGVTPVRVHVPAGRHVIKSYAEGY